jgi:hypothetical protein
MLQMSPEPIYYSSETIRWYYGDNTPGNEANLSKITKWWTSLHGKRIKMRSITETKRDKRGSYWQPSKEDPIQEFEIQNPKINHEFLSFDGSSIEEPIKIETIDFDPDPRQNKLIAHVNPAIKYVFILQ